jgi:hypothetical protein
VQHLDRIDLVDDEPLQLRVERRPCRAVGDAGRMASPRAAIDQARRSEDRFGGNTGASAYSAHALRSRETGSRPSRPVLLADTAESSRSTTRVSISTAVGGRFPSAYTTSSPLTLASR